MGRRFIAICLLSLVMAALCWSQTDPFMPPNPLAMGMGGAFTANAEGYNAFFYNPAGFARKSEFTLLSTNVYGVLDKKLYDMVATVVTAVVQGRDPMESLIQGQIMANSRDGVDPSALAAYGIDIDTAALEALSQTTTDVIDYLTEVAATPGGESAITAGLGALLEDPNVASALATAGINPDDPAAIAQLSADPSALAAALLPILLSDPTIVANLTNTFITTVQTESGVVAPPSVLAAGATLQGAIDTVVAGLTDSLPSGNASIGAMMGIGYVGNGLGLGLFANVNAGLYTPLGKSILSSMAKASTFLTLAGGYAVNLGETFSIGIQVRPTIIGYVSFLPSTLLTQLLSGSTPDQNTIIAAIMTNGVYKGFRIGVDIGALWDIGDFTLGLAVKDIFYGTELYKQYTDFDQFLANLADFKGAATMESAYKVPSLKVNVGVQWHPDLGVVNEVFDPRIALDLMDIGGWVRQLPGATAAEQLAAAKMKASMMSEYDFLQMINFGAQIKLFKFLTFSAGIGQGMATAGLGIRLLVVDVNLAVGARYKTDPVTKAFTSTSLSDFSEVGFSLEVAVLRF